MIRSRRDRGELSSAAELAGRGVSAHPEDLNLLRLEIDLQSGLEGEQIVLSRLEADLGSDPASTRRRVVLAASYRRRGDAVAALRVLAELAPVSGSELAGAWFEQRCAALADLGRLDELRATFAAWERSGGDPIELRARYALRVSTSQLVAETPLGLLRAALRDRAQLGDRELLRSLYERLIAHLLAEGREHEAVGVYDDAIREVDLPSLSRGQLARQAARKQRDPDYDREASGEVVFEFPAEAEGGVLLLSPPLGPAPCDARRVRP